MKNFFITLFNFTWPQKLLIFIIVTVLVSFVFRALTPTQVAVQNNILKNSAPVQSNLKNITYVGTTVSIPEKLSSYSLDNYEEISTEIKNNLLVKFELTPKGNVESVWESSEYSMSVLENPEQITLNRRLAAQSDSNTTFNQNNTDEIVRISNTLMLEIFPQDTPRIEAADIRYLTSRLEPRTTSNPAEAELILIPYIYQIDNYPVYLDQENQYVATFLFAANNELIKADFRPIRLSYSPIKNFQTINLELAMSNINNNYAALLYTDSYGPGGNGILDIVSGKLETVQIEYRADPATNTIIPYYHFYGQLIESSDRTTKAQIITPAIQTNFEASE